MFSGCWTFHGLAAAFAAAALPFVAAADSDCRPETWFHIIGGNASKAGLTADLEALKDAVKSSSPQMADGV
jgi:hypothetical protein